MSLDVVLMEIITESPIDSNMTSSIPVHQVYNYLNQLLFI